VSLEEWMDYFASSDSKYIPRELKYWIFRSVLGLQESVKILDGENERLEFPKRSKGTAKPFPEINGEALSYVVDAVKKRLDDQHVYFDDDATREDRERFARALDKMDFAELYAWSNELHNPAPERLLRVTKGRWVRYTQGPDWKALTRDIRGKGTGWCTAGEFTAKEQLEDGDFYVYFSLDDDGKPTIPRLAIRMLGQNRIAENPRGIAYRQNVDGDIAPILEEKLREFGPIGDAFRKKSSDMRELTEIEQKIFEGKPLDKEELTFLYEVNASIEGFGYSEDPRIKKLREQRDEEADMPTIFGCDKHQIARSIEQVNERTRAYVGMLEPGTFDKLPESLEFVYASFPEGRINLQRAEIGGKSAEELERILKQNGLRLIPIVEEMMKDERFITSKDPKTIRLARMRVADLGFPAGATFEQIRERGNALGLDDCPAEVGPHFRLLYRDQPKNDPVLVIMNPTISHNGEERVFKLFSGDSKMKLYLSYFTLNEPEDPNHVFEPEWQIIFRVRTPADPDRHD